MTKYLLLLPFIILSFYSTAPAQDDGAREVFKRTRIPATEPAPITVSKKTKPPSVSSNNSTTGRKKKRLPSGGNSIGQASKNDAPVSVNKKANQLTAIDSIDKRNVGLGYTLFLDNGSGMLLSVSPTRVFHTGQTVRLLLESNIEGYLYIFHRENDGQPKMLFPSWQDRKGDNYIQAHKPVLIPSENGITFTGKPAEETLIVAVSREPIMGLPLGEELRDREQVAVPLTLFQKMSQPCSCQEARDDTEGVPRKNNRGGRDLTLTKSDPLPAYILLSQDQNANRLTTRIKLKHGPR